MILLFLKRTEVAGLIQALSTILTTIAPVVETIVVMRLITAVVLLLVVMIVIRRMVPTTVGDDSSGGGDYEGERLRNRITAEMTTVVETTGGDESGGGDTGDETKAVAETSLTKAVEMTVEQLREATGTPDAA